jgi:hypothetical protein
LHRIRAHLLHYASLLDDFQKSVVFIRDTPNPAMNVLPEGQARSEQPLKSECDKLLGEIKRLEAWRSMLDKRVKSLMDLVGVLGLSRLTHAGKMNRCSRPSISRTARACRSCQRQPSTTAPQ